MVLVGGGSKDNLPAIEEPILQVGATYLVFHEAQLTARPERRAQVLRLRGLPQLLGGLLEETDEVPQRLLDVILGCLLAPKSDEKPVACRHAAGRALCAASRCTARSRARPLGAQAGAGAHPPQRGAPAARGAALPGRRHGRPGHRQRPA